MNHITLRCLYAHKGTGKLYATKRWVTDKTNDVAMIGYVEVKLYERHHMHLTGGRDIRQRTVRKRVDAFNYVRELSDFADKFRPATKADIERALTEGACKDG